MNKFTLKEVLSPEDKRKWLAFPAQLYKNDPFYVRPIDQDVEKLFDKKQNKLLRKGQAIRYLLYDESNEIVGRIAAFIDPNTAKNNDQPTGGCGFFDCIDDQAAATMLFDASKKWLAAREMEAMDGPVNFGDRDSFWGCLAEGFTEPLYNMPYNFPYYNKLFENYGFKNFFNQYTYQRMIYDGGLDEKVLEKAERVHRNPDYEFKMISWKNIDQFADDFMVIYNKAWGSIPGVKKITQVHALALLNQLKPILDPRLVHYGYYKNEPIAFFIMMQDLNQIIRKFNGKLNWFNKLRLMFELKTLKRCDRIIGRIFGIVPEHQGKGIDGGLIIAFRKVALKKGFPYKELQMNWIGDFNQPMMKVVESIGGEIYKTHITYRYLFDQSKPFKRATKGQ
ncbi:MAG: hypothetical protein KJ754_12705 [Bacteroidetes bacterium]|nr:hypothetical protein [Bacteroidota bacterium]MBU1580284.1 hypothetical protein [Bacteroidota bacterium]